MHLWHLPYLSLASLLKLESTWSRRHRSPMTTRCPRKLSRPDFGSVTSAKQWRPRRAPELHARAPGQRISLSLSLPLSLSLSLSLSSIAVSLRIMLMLVSCMPTPRWQQGEGRRTVSPAGKSGREGAAARRWIPRHEAAGEQGWLSASPG